MKEITMNTEEKLKKLHTDFDYLVSKINFKQSCFDAEAICILNNFKIDLTGLVTDLQSTTKSVFTVLVLGMNHQQVTDYIRSEQTKYNKDEMLFRPATATNYHIVDKELCIVHCLPYAHENREYHNVLSWAMSRKVIFAHIEEGY